MFVPKTSKFQKYQKGSWPNKIKARKKLKNYNYRCIFLISNDYGKLTTKQLMAIRAVIKKRTKKKAILQFSLFPNLKVTKKPLEIRMGKGKGMFSHWVAVVKKGTNICKIYTKKKFKIRIVRMLKRVQIRLPIKTKIKL